MVNPTLNVDFHMLPIGVQVNNKQEFLWSCLTIGSIWRYHGRPPATHRKKSTKCWLERPINKLRRLSLFAASKDSSLFNHMFLLGICKQQKHVQQIVPLTFRQNVVQQPMSRKVWFPLFAVWKNPIHHGCHLIEASPKGCLCEITDRSDSRSWNVATISWGW